MRRFLFALLAFALAPLFAHAQAPGVTLSESIAFSGGEVVGDDLLLVGGQPYLYTYDRPSIGLVAGKNKLSSTESLSVFGYGADDLAADESFTYDGFPDKRQHYALTGLGDLFVWTYVTESRGKSSGKKSEATYDLAADVIAADGKRVAQHKLGKIRVREFADATRKQARSPNREYLVQVVSNERGGQLVGKSDLAGFAAVAVIDASGDLVTEVTHRFAGKRDQVKLESVAVDDDGTAYLLSRAYPSQKSGGRGRNVGADGGAAYTLKSTILARGAEEGVTTTLSTAGKFSRGLTYYARRDGSLGIAGLYAEGPNGRIRGVLSASAADADAKLEVFTFDEGDYEGFGKRATKGKDKGLQRYYDMKGGANTSRGASLLMEGFYQSRFTNSSGATRITNYYTDGLIVDLDDGGALVRAERVPKKQAVQVQTAVMPGLSIATGGATDRYYTSISAVSLGDRLGVLYNDNPKNLLRETDDRAKKTNWGKAVAILAYLDDDGALVRRPLFDRRADKLLLHPSSGEVDAAGNVYVIGSRVRALAANEISIARLEPGAGGALSELPDFSEE